MNDPPLCPNPACEKPHVIRNGSHRGRARYHCRGCGRYFGETEGTPMYHLHTPVKDVAQTLLVVMRRGSLRGAADVTGHSYETIGIWVRRAAPHAEALSEVLVKELHLTTVEIDEFWSFVRKKTVSLTKRMPESDGDVWSKTGKVDSLSLMPVGESEKDWYRRPSPSPQSELSNDRLLGAVTDGKDMREFWPISIVVRFVSMDEFDVFCQKKFSSPKRSSIVIPAGTCSLLRSRPCWANGWLIQEPSMWNGSMAVYAIA